MVSLHFALISATALLTSSIVNAQSSGTTTPAVADVPTEVTDCHTHSDGYYCFEGSAEWEVTSEIADVETAPEDYTDCQAGENADTIQCSDGAGGQATLVREGSEGGEDEEHGGSGTSSTSSTASGSPSTTATTSAGTAATTATATSSSTDAAAETPSGTEAAAEESPSETAASAGTAVLPASGMSLFALLLAYFAI